MPMYMKQYSFTPPIVSYATARQLFLVKVFGVETRGIPRHGDNGTVQAVFANTAPFRVAGNTDKTGIATSN